MQARMNFIASLCVLASSLIGVQTAFATETASNCGIPSDARDGWAIGSPEEQALNSTLLCAMGDGISEGKLASVDDIVVVRHGVLVYERYYPQQQVHTDASTRHRGYSMTKSVVSLLVGIAVDRGWIKDLDVPIVSYFPENPDLRMADKAPITLRHLLTMSAKLGRSEAPGVSFDYNNGETELVGAVLQKATGKTVDVLARENIFAPLGITDVEWLKDPFSGIAQSARGLVLRPRDWAKIGQLVLDRGVWEGKQIVPASWVVKSTAEQIKTEGARSAEHIKAEGPDSYGYQWWLGRSLDKDRRVEWIAAMGFNSQKTIIIPTLDMVVVFNASRQSKNMVAPELDLLDRYILPAASN
jgi:CubicO group peptidase (beta-lactamase class C family)